MKRRWTILAVALWMVTPACSNSGGNSGGSDGGVDASSGSGSGGGSGSSSGSSSGGGGGSGSSGSGSSSGGGSGGSSGSSSGGGSGDSSGGASGSSSGGVDSGAPTTTGPVCPAVAAGDYESYGLPPVTNIPSGVTEVTDWTQQPAHGGWYGAQQMDACRYEADPNGFQTWHGKAAARLEVNPGDDPLDLGENTERTECLTEQDASGNQVSEGPTSGAVYYATSWYFSTAWAATSYPYSVFEAGGSSWPGNVSSDCSSAGNLCNSWSIVLQLHGPGGGSPWALLAAGSTAPGQPEKMWLSGTTDTQFSDGGQLVLGAWVDIVMEVDWGTPTISVWRRNEGQTAFTQVVSAASFPAAQAGTYLKQGLYRGGNVNGRTDVLWIGPTARGTTFAGVEMAAFGTASGP